MKIYLVGGTIRDELLKRPVTEKDWVVVGATPGDMEKKGFRIIGKDFPVFLHPNTKEEYALARTERKSGKGYTGFTFNTSTSVTLEEDLYRRDLTINAMAMDEQGNLIDPYNGQSDLKNKTLRHVSPAFAEDPLRVLRVARFAARYHHLGFIIADETLKLMQDIAASGELEFLVAERVWQELEKALREKNPELFFESLRKSHALKILLPEIDQLFGVPQTPKYHPEIDTGIHTMMVLQQACLLSEASTVRFAALTHDLGKGNTSREKWPKHVGHEERGAKLLTKMCKRLKVPKAYKEVAILVAKHHLVCHKAYELRTGTLLKLFEKVGALRNPKNFEHFLLACEADARGRKGFEDKAYPQANYLRKALETVSSVTADPFVQQGLVGKAIGEALYNARLKKLKKFKQEHQRKDD